MIHTRKNLHCNSGGNINKRDTVSIITNEKS